MMGMLSYFYKSFALIVFLSLTLIGHSRSDGMLVECRGKVADNILIHPKFILLPHKKCGRRKLLKFDGDVNSRIIHGKESELGEFPWMAKLYKVGSRSPSCGGSIISERHVLTAGHCCHYYKSMPNVGVGAIEYNTSGNEKLFKVKKYFIHPNFSNDPLPSTDVRGRNDICLLQLEKPMTFTEYIQPICLPIYKRFAEGYANGTEMAIAGWGRLEDDEHPRNLRKAKLTVTELDESYIYWSYGKNQSYSYGDSGGPLMKYDKTTKRWFLFGVHSAGVSQPTDNIYINLQTKVINYLGWILNIIRP